jgi:hypothetical protein
MIDEAATYGGFGGRGMIWYRVGGDVGQLRASEAVKMQDAILRVSVKWHLILLFVHYG